MDVWKGYAIVLRAVPYGDYDKMVSLLTPERGVVDAGARGCRSTRRRELLACTEVFTYGEYLIKTARGRHYIEQCAIQEAFLPIRQDALLFAHAALLVDCTRTLSSVEQHNQSLFTELLHALTQLNYSKAHPSDIMLCYLLRILRAAGFEPALNHCARCGAEVKEYAAFSPVIGGVLCAGCASSAMTGEALGKSVPTVLRHVLNMDHRELSRVRFEDWLRADLMRLLPSYAEHRLEKPIKSLPVLLSLLK